MVRTGDVAAFIPQVMADATQLSDPILQTLGVWSGGGEVRVARRTADPFCPEDHSYSVGSTQLNREAGEGELKEGVRLRQAPPWGSLFSPETGKVVAVAGQAGMRGPEGPAQRFQRLWLSL